VVVLQPILLVDEALAPALEGGGTADWGVVHAGQSSDEEEEGDEEAGEEEEEQRHWRQQRQADEKGAATMGKSDAGERRPRARRGRTAPAHPSAVVVGLVRRHRAESGGRSVGGHEEFDVQGVVEAADAVLRALRALPPPGSMLGGGGGQWWSRQWAAAVSASGMELATALAWPAVLTRAVSASKMAAAESALAGAVGAADTSGLLQTSLWSGLVERWRAVSRLQRRVGTLGFMALGEAGTALAEPSAMGREAKAAERAGIDLREHYAAVATVLMAETDAAVSAAMALSVASHHAHGGCGEWVESEPVLGVTRAVRAWWGWLVGRPEGWLVLVASAGLVGLAGRVAVIPVDMWHEQQRIRGSKRV
jgi:hypothetical protein